MARLPRLSIVDFPFHVVVRGADRRAIFLGDGDRLFFHRTLSEASRAHGLAVHAYVFMTNHVHLLVTGRSTDSMCKTIQALGRRYVRYFNFMHERTGPLWEGRFHSSVIDSDRYFIACQRYIEMNPVRAGICHKAIDFIWSSHRHYALAKPDELLTRHSIHGQYDPSQYCRIFELEVPADTVLAIRDAVNYGWALGDEAFRDRLGDLTARRAERSRAGRRRTQS